MAAATGIIAAAASMEAAGKQDDAAAAPSGSPAAGSNRQQGAAEVPTAAADAGSGGAGEAGSDVQQGAAAEPPADPDAVCREAGEAKCFAPARTATYLSPEYWDSRFAEEESYEWCKDYSAFRHLLAPHLRTTDAILELGCGNSGLGVALVADGYADVTCSDLSATVVRRMAERATVARQAIKYRVADMMELPFAKGSFDVVLEKGAIEVFFTDSTSAWDPQPAVRRRVAAALSEAHRVLTPGGVFISISFGQPHFRTPLFLANPAHTWDCQVARFGDAFDYFVYVLRKGRRLGKEGSKVAAVGGKAVLGPAVRERGAEEEAPMHAHMDKEDYLLHMAL